MGGSGRGNGGSSVRFGVLSGLVPGWLVDSRPFSVVQLETRHMSDAVHDDPILDEIREFLGCETPVEWLDQAVTQLEVLLVDHAQCEQKAAASAMHMMYRYPDDAELSLRMSKLAREELRHFEQVLQIMRRRGLAYRPQTASRYASGLRTLVRPQEPARRIDLLVAGAFIEARSCERFACLAPRLDPELGQFYTGLLASEGRHYRNYLRLATERAGVQEVAARVALFRAREAELIQSPDTQFRFHSGRPAPSERHVAAV